MPGLRKKCLPKDEDDMIDEHALIEQWKKGGRHGNRAFEALYEKYDAKIRRDAKRLGQDPDDTSQDVWLRVTSDLQAGTIGNYGEFQAYLFRVTQMACSRDALDADEPSMVSLDDVDDSLGGMTPSAEDVVSASQLAIIAAVTALEMPREVREAWVLKRRGDTDEYAAKLLEISERTYRSRVATARAILQEALDKAK